MSEPDVLLRSVAALEQGLLTRDTVLGFRVRPVQD